MELTMATAAEYTAYLFREYYHLNTEPFFSVLDPDMMWIGPGNLFVFGASAVKSYFNDGFVMPRIELEDAEFFLLQAGKESCIVVGRFSCYTAQDADKVAAVSQRATACYRHCGKDNLLKLTHLHVSNEWSELVDDEIFPLKISMQTYRYVQKLAAEHCVKSKRKKIELQNGTGLQYIDADMVIYAEAVGKYTVMHFANQIVTIKRMIGELAPLFPESFCRPHRGYLVNCQYISSVERYSISLVTGMIIPIPEKRYTQVREEIAAIMKRI